MINVAGQVEHRAPAVAAPSPLALALVADIDARLNGDWGRCARSGVIQAQAMRDCEQERDDHVRGGMVSARILELTPVTIRPLHAFAGNAIMPAASAQEHQQAWAYLSTQPPMLGHSHHISLNYQRLIRLGVEGISKQVRDHLDRPSLSDEQRSFYRGVQLSLQGLAAYGGRYRAEAQRLLEVEADAARCRELERIIDALEQVPARPARTLFEAMQSMLLLHLGSRTAEPDSAVGRLDLFLAEYYERDLEEGRITPEDAADLIQRFMAQLLELTRFSDCIVVGGCQSDGVTPFVNDLSYFILDAVKHLKIPTPEIGFRYCPGQPRELLRRGMECIRAGTGHPGFFNDPVCIAALEKSGMTREQAADYANCNCVELTSAGRSSIVSGYHYLNLVKLIEVMLNDGKEMIEDTGRWMPRTPTMPSDVPGPVSDFEGFLAAYERYLYSAIDGVVAETNQRLESNRTSRRTFIPLSSAFIEGCLESGRHCMLGGAVCSQTFPTFVGFVNAVNSLCAIRCAVFEAKLVSLETLANACRANLVGHEQLREYLLHKCPRYGNDDPQADALAQRLYDGIARRLEGQRNPFGHLYGPQYFGWLCHAWRGEKTAATPDGRLAGEAVSGTLGGDGGTDAEGPTALLNSATRLDHTKSGGGIAVNLAVAPGMLRRDRDVELMIDLMLAYFDKGGMQLQLNCTPVETLLEARREPHKHRNLLVRVAGYCDRFVCLDASVQQDIIARTQHAHS